MNARAHRSRTGERGHALLYVTILGTLAMGLWATAFRATHDAINADGFFRQREARSHTLKRAMAVGATLLRTGDPPSDPYSCYVKLKSSEKKSNKDKDKFSYSTLVFRNKGGETWSIEAWPSSKLELKKYQPAPGSFAGEGKGKGGEDDDD